MLLDWAEAHLKAEGFAFQELHLTVQGIRAPVTFFSGEIIQEE